MSLDEDTIQQAWEKGKAVKNYDPDVKRKDAAQAWIFLVVQHIFYQRLS